MNHKEVIYVREGLTPRMRGKFFAAKHAGNVYDALYWTGKTWVRNCMEGGWWDSLDKLTASLQSAGYKYEVEL